MYKKPIKRITDPPNEPGVLYVDSNGRQDSLYLSSFAQWCKEEVD